jgi:hypothetical protein
MLATQVTIAAQLLSHKACERALQDAVKAAGVDTSALEVRGKLETSGAISSDELRLLRDAPVIRHFLVVLEAAAGIARSEPAPSSALTLSASEAHLYRAVELCAKLAEGCPSHVLTRPKRSLVGKVTDSRSGRQFDIALIRDGAETDRRFSLVLASKRPASKVANVRPERSSAG